MTLKGLTYPNPSDLNVLLVAPDAKNLLVMSDVGGTPDNVFTVSNIDLTFDDQAANFAPATLLAAPGTAVTYKPTHLEAAGETFTTDTFSSTLPPPSPQFTGPTPSGAAALSVFNGSNPNGDWKLYIVDDEPGPPTAGQFSGGWCINITTGTAPRQPVSDFNGDGKTDAAVFRPSTGTWYAQGSPVVNWGSSTDIPVPGYYNGDGKTDIAVFRPSTGTWYIQGGATTNWGSSGDIPVPGDYNGDGTTDIAVFRPSTGTWYVSLSGGGTTVTNWGASGDIPVPGDYNGDGKTDIAVFRPSTGTWYINLSGGGTTVTNWGASGDIPVPGDYNGDGKTDVAVFRPSTGTWYISLSGGGTTVTNWGASGDIPVPGDYNGDGTTDIAVFRPSTGTWYVQGGPTVNWGSSGDRPLPLPSAIRQVFFP